MFAKKAHTKDSLKASLALAACLTVLAVFVVVLGGYRFWESFDNYSMRFKSVKDLATGRPVKYGGLNVGRILSVGVDPDDPRLIRVVIGVERGMALHQGIVARIAQKGLVGDYYVFLDPQGEPGPVLPPGSLLPTVESVDLSQLAGMAGEILQDLQPKLERIAASLEQVLTSENSAKVTEFLDKAPVLLDDLRTAANKIQRDWTKLTTDGRETAKTATQTLTRLQVTIDSLKGEIDAALKEVQGGAQNVKSLSGNLDLAIKRDQGKVEDILENVDRLSLEFKQLVQRLRERPWELVRQPTEAKP